MKKINFLIKNSIAILTIVVLVFYGFAFMEPVLVVAVEATDSIGVNQSVTAGITISAPADITMTALSLTQDSAVGDASWTVITNNQAGYALTIKASAAPALVDSGTSESFADYTSTTKETWSVTNAFEFGWSAYGNHTTGHGTDTDCIAGADVPSAGLLWEGLDGTTPIQMASSTSETNMAGTVTTICVATEQDTVFAPSGTYTATLTATATSL